MEDRENNEIEKKKKKKTIKIFIIIFFMLIILGALAFGYLVFENRRVKPIIYLYPTQEEEVEVKLEYPQSITVSYPKYIDGWRVLAKSNGNLVDLDTGRNLYSLYYESDNNDNFKIEKEGFCIKGEETEITTFLEDKLTKLGLEGREIEEFIIYWLPILNENNYNYIRFASIDEIESGMPLKIVPEPDSLIRVLMIYKGLNNPVDVTEQNIITPERKGFVAVEWGGTEIK